MRVLAGSRFVYFVKRIFFQIECDVAFATIDFDTEEVITASRQRRFSDQRMD